MIWKYNSSKHLKIITDMRGKIFKYICTSLFWWHRITRGFICNNENEICSSLQATALVSCVRMSYLYEGMLPNVRILFTLSMAASSGLWFGPLPA